MHINNSFHIKTRYRRFSLWIGHNWVVSKGHKILLCHPNMKRYQFFLIYLGNKQTQILTLITLSNLHLYSRTWELGTPKGLWKAVLNSEVVLFLRSISMYWICLGTEVTVLRSQVVPISQVVLKTSFTVFSRSSNICLWMPFTFLTNSLILYQHESPSPHKQFHTFATLTYIAQTYI